MKRRGYTLVEMIFVTIIVGMVVLGVTSFLVSTAMSFGQISNQYYSNVSLSTAVQYLNRDIQQAKRVNYVSPTHIIIQYPIREADGTYNRKTLDTVNTVEYFRANPDGNKDSLGTVLFRQVSGESARVVCRDVFTLLFSNHSPTSVTVSLCVKRKSFVSDKEAEVADQVMFMRNS